jgi:hypothetical protein
MTVREVLQLLGSFGLGGLIVALVMHRLNDGRLRVRAAFHPNPKLDTTFPTGSVRLHLVNVGRRPVRIVRAGAELKKPTMYGIDFWVKDFQPIALEPDGAADVDVLDFGSFHSNIKEILVEDVRGRRFKVGWRNLRELRHVKRRWERDHPLG